MATAAPNQNLPLFYSALEPLNVTQHGKMKIRAIDKAPVIAATHAIPATVDEFALLQRHYPIVFSVGETPAPMRSSVPWSASKMSLLNRLIRPRTLTASRFDPA